MRTKFILDVIEACKNDLAKRDCIGAFGRLAVLEDKIKEEERSNNTTKDGN